ncbi:MAG TPA: peptide deformylase [Gaiellaceae bacterium]
MAEVEGQVRSEELDAEREARRRLALAQVRQYPDPVLRMQAREVEEIDEAVTGLVERMRGLMTEARGVGLAAPQLGILRRVLVYQTGEEEPFVALVNPRVVEAGDEQVADDEGCLSLAAATVIVEVERPATIVVEGTSPEGEDLRIEAEGLEARVIQHELDHLDGVLIIDRASAEQRREALAKLRPQPVLGPA